VIDARLLFVFLQEQLDTTEPDKFCSLIVGFGISCEAYTDGEPLRR